MSNEEDTKQLALTLPTVVFLCCMEIGGAPFGVEPAVGAVGPLFALLGTLIFPFIVSVPCTHITAELSSIAPAFRSPFWGFLIRSVIYLSRVVDLAISTVLCHEYLEKVYRGLPRALVLLLLTLSLSFLNYIGLLRRGRYTSACLFLLPLFLFLVMSLIANPKISIQRCFSTGQEGVKKNWNLPLTTLLWKFSFWKFDNPSAREMLTDKLKEKSLLFKAHFNISVTLTCFTHAIPVVAVAGALSVNQDEWKDGFFVIAAEMIAGKWLQDMFQIAAALSTLQEYDDGITNCSYQLVRMTEMGCLPHCIGFHSIRFHTPWVAILVSTGLATTVLFVDFEYLVALVSFFGSFTALLELTLFLCLRWKSPDLNRTFRVHMRMPGPVVMCLVVSVPYVLTLERKRYYVFPMMTCVAFAVIKLLYLLMQHCKKKMWLRFTDSAEQATGEEAGEVQIYYRDETGPAPDMPADSIQGGHHCYGDEPGDFSDERLDGDQSGGPIGFTESDSGALDFDGSSPEAIQFDFEAFDAEDGEDEGGDVARHGARPQPSSLPDNHLPPATEEFWVKIGFGSEPTVGSGEDEDGFDDGGGLGAAALMTE
ncbi:probable polyamine transporter At3g13620 [Malania oleifera]|uniref:probable polyamine transporter At3g13620 n=1 Tax=Malania oleifera TaxID=397392 RepID=UPI0025ADC84B|nr:probable polyamine transporter At3g13620 [Malania oleifera]